jgi:phosphate butyryltransferase
MAIDSFDRLLGMLGKAKGPKRMVLVGAQDGHALEAAYRAREAGIAEPLLVGEGLRIESSLSALGIGRGEAEIIDVPASAELGPEASWARVGVALVRDGRADFILKGGIHTAELLHAVLDRERGLRGEGLMSHLGVFEIPGYHKLLAVTDGGMVDRPDLAQKRLIIENAVRAFRRFGYELPKVAVLAAIEVVNERMPETVDAAALKRMCADGVIKNCLVEGPISYDLAVDRESASSKGYSSPVAGDADILVAPDLVSGNILGKIFAFTVRARMAGFIVGAKAPIAIVSRGAGAEDKLLSLAIAAAAS